LVIHLRRLLIRPGAIGDFILSLPALESLRADFTEVWCASQNVPLARFADRAQSIVASGLFRVGLLPGEDVIERLRSFDSIISWHGAGNPEFRALTAQLDLPFHFLPALPSPPGHAVDFYNAQARGLGAAVTSRFPKVPCPPGERTFGVIHPFAASPGKRAPMATFESTAKRLAAVMPVYWLRGPEDLLDGAVFIPDLYELACWLRKARVFIGNDSGISHLAAAVGTPVQVFFRTTSPNLWAPRGPAVNTTILRIFPA
jgi:ADP-heptose:LPS heptosyltransferase